MLRALELDAYATAPDLERERRLHVEYYERVRQLVASARGADRVVLLNLQLVALYVR